MLDDGVDEAVAAPVKDDRGTPLFVGMPSDEGGAEDECRVCWNEKSDDDGVELRCRRCSGCAAGTVFVEAADADAARIRTSIAPRRDIIIIVLLREMEFELCIPHVGVLWTSEA